VIRSITRSYRSSRTALIAIAAVLLGMLASGEPALAATSHRTVRFDGVQLRVPAGWPVFHLSARSHVCVRFNRHAVYLGTPGSDQLCPRQAIGRTEAILVSPATYHGQLLTPVSRLTAATAEGSMARLHDVADHVIITATWGRDPQVIRAALGVRSLRAAMLATNGHQPTVVGAGPRLAHVRPRQTSSASPSTPGEVYAGLGFDVCSTPSTVSMSAWGQSSPYAAIGIYIGGVNAACLGGNLNAGWVQAESLAGWHMLPLYVGLQAPGGCCQAMSSTVTDGQYATAASQGTAAAQDAVTQAQALGIGTGNPIYYDMENYRRSTSNSGAVLAFLQAWTQQLHTSGYLSGVYSSGSSGITDLAANYGTTYVEPDELWTADWDSSAPSTPPTSAANPYVPAADWPGTHQLLQYWSDPGRSPESYGGASIGIDRDYVDAPTAAYGSGTLVTQVIGAPTLAIKPQANGWVNLVPAWASQPGIAQYAILAGASPLALSSVGTVSATSGPPVKLQAVHAYYAVQGLNSAGQVVGTSAPIQTPASLAIFGNSAYVGARGPVGVPVACLNLTPCQLAAQIFAGTRRIAHSDIHGIASQGGQLLVPMSAKIHRLVAAATGHRLPVTVRLTSATGASASRPLNLVPYTVSGPAPRRRTWPGSTLQILASTSYVSNAWTGGVLAVCRATVPCVAAVTVSRAGNTIASPRTTTLGPGEVGYLTYTLNRVGHRLLRAAPGNQLGARLSVSTTAPVLTTSTTSTTTTTTTPTTTTTATTTTTGTATVPSGGASIASAAKTSMALISLVAFR
jgi:hypothetical protein